MTPAVTPEDAPLTPAARLLQSLTVGALASSMVLVSAALSSLLFDRLPSYLDVILVVFVFPFTSMIAVLMFDVKVLTPLVPNWLRRHDGHVADLPSLIGGAVLAGAIAAIFPGMFAGLTYAKLVVNGPAFDVTPHEASRDAGFYRFRDSSLRAELSGSLARTVVVADGNFAEKETRVTYAAPIVANRWSASEPVAIWAITDDEIPPWETDTVGLLRGVHLSDERGHRTDAVRSIAQEHGLDLGDTLVLLRLSDSYEVVRKTASRKTWMMLVPLCLLVFVFVSRNAWQVLGPEYGQWGKRAS